MKPQNPTKMIKEIEKEIERMTFCINCMRSKTLCICNYDGYHYVVWSETIRNVIISLLEAREKEIEKFLSQGEGK